MNKERLKYLFRNYQSQTLTAEERLEWTMLIKDPLLDHTLKDIFDEEWYAYNADEIKVMDHSKSDKIINHIINNPQHTNRKRKLWNRIAIAASFILISMLAFYFIKDDSRSPYTSQYSNDVKPGKSSATLTLSDGKKIALSDGVQGELAKESGIPITKDQNNRLVYEIKEHGAGQTNLSNTLTTAKGETFEVKLPDGTTVWLNSSSSIKYPVSFAGLKSRHIELIGEAYFEVTKDKAHPFIVRTIQQEVEVLGTHFNINSYPDEPSVKTTLLEGSVKVKGENTAILKPGQQASVSGNDVRVQDIDTELAIAWKNNNFIFEHNDIQFIMRMIARWYNVNVTYEGPVPNEKFGGTVSRFENVSKVLQILESTDKVHFKIKGRTILVSK